MEWEKKFYDIISETESNLARARLKLQGKSLLKDTDRNVDKLYPFHKSSNSAQFLTSTTPLDSGLYGQLGPVALRRYERASVSLQDEQTSEMGELLKKIDSQNMMIDRLERLVQTLNQEKHQYRRHITDLQHEVGDISSKLKESKYLEPHLESQVDLMRHEVRSDMHRLHNMIAAARTSSLQSSGLERSFKDMQHSVHGELEGLRRDLNFMTHRVGRLELDISSHSIGQKDLHDRLNAGVLSSSYSGQMGQRNFLKGGPSSPEKSQLKSLRSTLSDLHDKLDSLEGQVAASSAVPALSSHRLSGLPKSYKKATVGLSRRKYNFSNDDDDDDDDDESSDLDELDLSDLDLSSEEDEDEDEDGSEVSEELEKVIRRSVAGTRTAPAITAGGLRTSGRSARVTLADLDLSSDGHPTDSSEGPDLSDLDLNNLDLSSAGGSFDLGSLDGGNSDLKLDDL